MPDITAGRPVSGAPIETGWGTQVHDAVEGIQVGGVVISGATSTVEGSTAVVFPRPYVTAPTILITSPSTAVGVRAGSITATGFTASAKRNDGSSTAYSGTYPWIAVGTPA
jgi:hypothetical protein